MVPAFHCVFLSKMIGARTMPLLPFQAKNLLVKCSITHLSFAGEISFDLNF
jgi:hypothetical protein